MLKIENTEVMGWEHAIRGMRNPKNSWEKSDSFVPCDVKTECHKCADNQKCEKYFSDYGKGVAFRHGQFLGSNDHTLMMQLRNAGTDHRKFMRMIVVYLDITAPLYWWKEFKTYRAGKRFGDDEPDIIDDGYLEYDIEMNSCSTMHKIAAKEFTLDDFSHEHLCDDELALLEEVIARLNMNRIVFIAENDKQVDRYTVMSDECYAKYKKTLWWQMIQLLPSSYNQRRTVMLNYEVLANMYKSRRHHKLDEWHTFCDWIESLPYSELITGKEKTL